MLYVFYSIHMIAYSGGAPIQSSLRRPSGSNKALVLSESSDISVDSIEPRKKQWHSETSWLLFALFRLKVIQWP